MAIAKYLSTYDFLPWEARELLRTFEDLSGASQELSGASQRLLRTSSAAFQQPFSSLSGAFQDHMRGNIKFWDQSHLSPPGGPEAGFRPTLSRPCECQLQVSIFHDQDAHMSWKYAFL